MRRSRLFLFSLLLFLVLLPCRVPAEESAESSLPSVEIPGTYIEQANGYVANVSLTCEGGLPIVYTTDGSDPEASSERYKEPFTLSPREPFLASPQIVPLMNLEGKTMEAEGFPQALILKAAALGPDGETGPVTVRTFFPGLDLQHYFPDLPVLSLVTDPANLLDYDTGILVKGRLYDEWEGTEDYDAVMQEKLFWKAKGNFMMKGKDWERPASLELFEAGSREAAFTVGCGIRLHGIASRQYAQKAFNVYFREEYGCKQLSHPLIPGAVSEYSWEGITEYKSFVLDNGGNATELTKYRDDLFHSLAREAGLQVSTLASRPCVLFLNGEFWGLYMIQEKHSTKYFADHFGVDKDNVVVFKEGELDEGEDEDTALYDEYMAYAEKDLSDPAVWEAFTQAVDISSMADYYAYEIYIANADWADDKNISLWRTRDPAGSSAWDDGKWRFNLFDLEFAAGIYNAEETSPAYDSLRLQAEQHAVFRAAMANETFREMLKGRLQALEAFLSSPAAAADIDAYNQIFEPVNAMQDHRYHLWERYNLAKTNSEGPTADEANLRSFLEQRPETIREVILPEIDAAGSGR